MMIWFTLSWLSGNNVFFLFYFHCSCNTNTTIKVNTVYWRVSWFTTTQKKRKKKNKSIGMVKSIKQNTGKYYKVFDQIRFNIFLKRYFITYTATLENTIKSTSYHCIKIILIIHRQIRHSLIQRLPNAECRMPTAKTLNTFVFSWSDYVSILLM